MMDNSSRLEYASYELNLPVFLSLAESHLEDMSHLCNLCSLLTHSVSGSFNNYATPSPHHNTLFQVASFTRKAQLRQRVMEYNETTESVHASYERMKLIMEEVNRVLINEEHQRIADCSDAASLIAYHVELSYRAMRTCFHSSIEEEAYGIDQHTHDCRTVALAALQASVSRLKSIHADKE
mmetsp:Transcript_27548/g.39443  ORF Transcript_27548/g.39443 Transcript_27548/m.39443 type:complete len:181 (-) Transcript_27548:1297-1839(-)